VKKKRLFVWTKFESDHTDGLAFAIAHDEVQARAMVSEIYCQYGLSIHIWGDLHVHELDESVAYAESGGG
jgi:hypothetical protein